MGATVSRSAAVAALPLAYAKAPSNSGHRSSSASASDAGNGTGGASARSRHRSSRQVRPDAAVVIAAIDELNLDFHSVHPLPAAAATPDLQPAQPAQRPHAPPADPHPPPVGPRRHDPVAGAGAADVGGPSQLDENWSSSSSRSSSLPNGGGDAGSNSSSSSTSPVVNSFSLRRSLDIVPPRIVDPTFSHVPFPLPDGGSSHHGLQYATPPSSSPGLARRFGFMKPREDLSELDPLAVASSPAARHLYSAAEEEAHALEYLEGEDEQAIEAYLFTLKLDRESEEYRLAKRLKTIYFGQQTSFSAVGLCSMRLKYISPNIGLMYSTVILQLCCNDLTSIPPEIGYLKKLQILSLENNKIVSLPASIGYLCDLVELNVSKNKLAAVPNSIGMLSKLSVLALDHNSITSLPSEIGKLKSLNSLNVSFNPIKIFPAEIARLKFLRRIFLEECPLDLEVPPPPVDIPAQVPSLKELVGRHIIRNRVPIHSSMPQHLKDFLASARPCSFCGGPFMDVVVIRKRVMEKGEDSIPLEYRLCSVHWTTEEERIQAMFAQRPSTAMPPASAAHAAVPGRSSARLSKAAASEQLKESSRSRAQSATASALTPSSSKSSLWRLSSSHLTSRQQRSQQHLAASSGSTASPSPSASPSASPRPSRRPLSGFFKLPPLENNATQTSSQDGPVAGEEAIEETMEPVSSLMRSPSLPMLPESSPRVIRAKVMRLNRLRSSRSISSFGPFE